MKKEELEKFRQILLEKKRSILENSQKSSNEDLGIDVNELPDQMDMASSEYFQYFTFRLKGREKTFLEKIDKAIQKIDAGTYGICDECEEEISIKRLEARPETNLCIRCKEKQEKAEREYGE